MKELILIGIDGATLNFIEPLIKDGELPNFKKIIEGGVSGELESTIPPSTVPAWYSYLTGKDPGNLGFYAWRQYNSENQTVERLRLESINENCFWDYFDDDIKSGVVNIPSVYPPQDFDGWFVGGFGVPGLSKDYTRPKNFKEELESELGGYRLYTKRWSEGDDEEYVENLHEVLNQRFSAAKYIWENKDCDLLNVVFRATDQASHYLGHDREEIDNVYKRMDEILSYFLDTGKDVLIMSDHGFSREEKSLQVNALLKKLGYLKTKKDKKSLKVKVISKIFQKLRNVVRYFGIREFADKYKKLRDLIPERNNLGLKNALISGVIDWEETKAFADSQAKTGFIFLKKESKKEKGRIVEDLKEEIDKLGLNVEVKKGNEVWKGPPKDFPDILLISRQENLAIESEFDKGEIVTKIETRYNHDFPGIFMAYGPDFKEGFELEDAEINDIAPTILHMMGEKVPKDMDGKVLKEIFKEGSDLAEKEVGYCEPLGSKESKEVEVDKEEEEKVKERLRDLGYME